MKIPRFPSAALSLFGALLLLPTGAGAGSIEGTVTYEGKVPNLPPIKMSADPECAKKHDKPVPNPILTLGDGQTMANIFVRVKTGLPDEDYPTPEEPAVLDQQGCMYEPHVFGIQTGQTLRILNSDGLLHNVHALPKKNQEFNMAMPANRKEATTTFKKAEGIFKFKCDVHPWMTAYTAVLKHPYFDVTEKDGAFEISGLPAGTYEIEAWHEKLGTKTAEVTVGEEETKTVDFTMTVPKR